MVAPVSAVPLIATAFRFALLTGPVFDEIATAGATVSTMTTEAELSAPTHAVPKNGVTVYFHVPSGTFVSVQVKAPVIAPPQFEFTVCAVSPEL